jgi:hypothetical protein
MVEEYERRQAAGSYRPEQAPWERDEMKSTRPQSAAAISKTNTNYKYQPLHEPLQPSRAQLKMMREYKTTAPFSTDNNYNANVDPSVGGRRSAYSQATSVAPWMQGREIPAQQILRRATVIPSQKNRASTALWDVPAPLPASVESSGDPILDKLKSQLKAFGANGILGLSRKFRIMVSYISSLSYAFIPLLFTPAIKDDDNSGTINFDEFCKGLRECRLELSAREQSYLFKYFDKVE